MRVGNNYSGPRWLFSQNDQAYYERRDKLLAAVRRHGFATCAELAAELRWGSNETRAKLVSLRKDGLVYYEPVGAEWHEETE